jgi:hypothetical protein
MKKAGERLRQSILEVVDSQIRELNPPATKETFDRLIREGHDPDEARRLIGNVVASEIFDVLTNMEPYDEDRFVRALHRLPDLPE